MNSWAHEICTNDNEERAIVIASMNEFAYVLQAWMPLLIWKQTDAPKYHKGYTVAAAFSVAPIILALAIRILQGRASVRGSVESDIVLGQDGTKGETMRAKSDDLIEKTIEL
jgi:MFS transporter, ACS family, pantothenate transporter